MVRKLAIVATASAVLMAGGVAALALYRPSPGAVVEVRIEPGTSTTAIADQLQRAGIIGSTFGFRVAAKLRGVDGDIAAGRYELRRSMGVQAALDVLADGPVERVVRVTIPEGYTVRQIARRLAERTHLKEPDVLAAAGSIRSPIQPSGVTSLEGLLFPETYGIEERETAEDVLKRMVATFNERVAKLDRSKIDAKGISLYEAVIVASLVEREARVPEDRAKVAAVVYNRLAKGMRLEIDATALYDLPAHKVPNRRDLRRDTPYNTYLHAGLPPTPIANPGLAALEAAFDPAGIDALYYVVIDPSGRHGFTASYEEFLRLKELRPAEVRGS